MNFGLVTDIQTDIQTEYDAYEPTVHTHRWAQKLTSLVAVGSARTPKTKYCSLKGMQSMGPPLDVLY